MRASLVAVWLVASLVGAACGPGAGASTASSAAPTGTDGSQAEATATPRPPADPTPKPTGTPLPILAPTATIPVAAPNLALVTEDRVYIQAAGTVVEIDPATNETRTVVDGQGERWSVGAGFGSLWTTHDGGGTIPDWGERIDIASGKVLARYEIGGLPLDPIAAYGAIWIPQHHGASVSRIDPATNAVTTIPVAGARFDPTALAAGGGRIWANSPNGFTLTAIDGATNAVVLQVTVVAQMCGVGYLVDRVWLGPCRRGASFAYDPATGAQLARLEGMPLSDGTHLFGLFADVDGGTSRLSRHDATTLEIQASWQVEGGPGGAVIGFGSLWVMGRDAVLRLPLDVLAG